MSTQRLFVALRPPAYVRDDLSARLSNLNLSRLRRVPPDDWHITVAFIGPVRQDASCKVAAAVEETAGLATQQLSLRLAGGGCFDPGARNIVHVGLDGDVAALTGIADDLDTRLGRIGFAGKQRCYVPHLTVSYVHGRLSGSEIAADLAVLEKYRGPRWVATELVLYRSDLGAAVRYEQLERYVLP